MKILNFGSCNVDYVYSLDHIVSVGETETTYKLETFPGGKGLNQSIATARAGVRVYHAGCIGEDGQMLLDVLKDSGVDVSYIKKVEQKNGHAIIQVSKSGENSIFLYPGSNEMITKEYIDSVLKNFSEGDILLLQNEISNIDYIIEKAYRKNMCIILNPSPFNEKITSLDFSMISYVILNEVESEGISGCREAEKSIAFFETNYPSLKVMLTLGEKGCIYADNTQKIRQSAYKVKAVDTTAAGDTFTGYFVAGIAMGEEYSQILKKASLASAIAVTKEGAAPSIPTHKEVLCSLNNFKMRKTEKKTDVIKTKIENYIDKNIQNATLEELSAILGYSTAYTTTLIKELTGESFSKLLQSKRCEIAAYKLLNTDLSIKQIICEVGYENESFFRKKFKENYGKNPLEFRKNQN